MNFSIGSIEIIFAFAIALCWVASIVLDAASDALIDNDGKRRHTSEAFSIVFVLLGALLILYALTGGYDVSLFSILKYPALRLGLFNLVYNHYREGIKWDYLGQTDWFDRQLIKVRDFGVRKRIPILFFIYFLVTGISFFIL